MDKFKGPFPLLSCQLLFKKWCLPHGGRTLGGKGPLNTDS